MLFNLFTPRKSRKIAAPATDALPDHAGFRVAIYIGDRAPIVADYATLHAAQCRAMRARDNIAETNIHLTRRLGRPAKTPLKITIQNLESGRFMPYLWELTRGELVA